MDIHYVRLQLPVNFTELKGGKVTVRPRSTLALRHPEYIDQF